MSTTFTCELILTLEGIISGSTIVWSTRKIAPLLGAQSNSMWSTSRKNLVYIHTGCVSVCADGRKATSGIRAVRISAMGSVTYKGRVPNVSTLNLASRINSQMTGVEIKSTSLTVSHTPFQNYRPS